MIPLFTTIWTLIAGVIVLFLPGLAWQALFRDAEQDLFERLAEALGVSISITALLALLAYLLNWSITSPVLILVYMLLVPPAIWSLRQWWRDSQPNKKSPNKSDKDQVLTETTHTNDDDWFTQRQDILRYLILALIFLAALLWRFYQIREVVLPLWVDSVHHVQIVNLMLEHGGIPESFEPFMPVPFFYHYAFHSLAAAFSTSAGLSAQDAVLYLGQVINAGIVLAVYRLGVALWGGWRRAALGAILVAFVTQMPAYYVTWGRYTLLTGMLLLPLAMATALDICNKGADRARLMTLAVLTAGILLSHYFAAGLLALFLIVLGASALISGIKNNEQFGWKTWLPLLLASLTGFLLASPWHYRMWGFANTWVQLVPIPPSMEAVDRLYFPEYLDYLWRLVGPDRNHILLFVALPGLILVLYRSRTRVFGIWALLLGLLSLPVGILIAPFRPDHAVIILFLPTALLVADLFISLIDWSPVEKLEPVKTALVLIIFAALVGWGIWETRTVINSSTILATEADLEAIEWIDANLPPEARFLINVTHWQYGSYRGVDGGWWITPLTRRMTSLPSGLSGMGDQEYVEGVNAIAAQVNTMVGCSAEFWELARANSYSHVYLRQGQGAIQPDQLESCPGVELIYESRGVFLYSIKDIINPGT
jgi:hypothetical protein